MIDTGTPSRSGTTFAANPVYVTDLDRCAPAAALADGPDRGRWRKLSYETDEISGVMLLAGPETAAPELTYPLAASGWHAVSIGAFGGHFESDTTTVEARLSGDSTFSRLTTPVERGGHRGRSPGEVQLREVFWKVADLTGQDLVLRQIFWRVAEGDSPGAIKGYNARVAYIKLVPLSDDEVEAYRADLRRSDTRRLFAHNDAHGIHFGSRPTTAEEIRRNIEPYRDTDFSRIYWEAAGGDRVQYLSKIGRVPTHDDVTDFGRQGDRLLAESWRAFRDQGVDPFHVALDHAHEIGLEFHAGYRVSGFHFPPPLDRANEDTSFYMSHPELRGSDRNGNRTPRLSYAYPATREFVVSMLSEIASFPVDGVALLYNRRPPLAEYEPPIVDGFMTEHGDDPRRLDEMDPRWLSYRARVLTQFMREVRRAMDAVAEEQGRRRIEVSAIVLATEQENLYRGMDLRAWVREGLVDTLIPYSTAPNYNSFMDSWTDQTDLDFHVSITKGTPCKLAPNLMPRDMTAEDYMQRAGALYEAGIENLFFWDCSENRGGPDVQSWTALRRLGHREEVEAWNAAGGPSLASPSAAVTMLGDWDMRYQTPG